MTCNMGLRRATPAGERVPKTVRALRVTLIPFAVAALAGPVVPAARADGPVRSATVVTRVVGCGGYSNACFPYPARLFVFNSHGHRVLRRHSRKGFFDLKLVPGRYTIVMKAYGSGAILGKRQKRRINAKPGEVTRLKFAVGIP